MLVINYITLIKYTTRKYLGKTAEPDPNDPPAPGVVEPPAPGVVDPESPVPDEPVSPVPDEPVAPVPLLLWLIPLLFVPPDQ